MANLTEAPDVARKMAPVLQTQCIVRWEGVAKSEWTLRILAGNATGQYAQAADLIGQNLGLLGLLQGAQLQMLVVAVIYVWKSLRLGFWEKRIETRVKNLKDKTKCSAP